jgi:HK97 family phage portal protein
LGAIDTMKSWFTRAPSRGGQQSSDIGTAVASTRSAPRRAGAELLVDYSNLPWLRAVASRIAQSVAAVAWTVEVPVRTRGGKKEPFRSKAAERDASTRERMRKAGELQAVEDHALLDFLHAGNPKLDGASCIEVTQLSIELMGEAFWALVPDGEGTPTEYWPMPPSWVTRLPENGDDTYEMRIRGKTVRFPAERVVWFKSPDPVDPYGRGTGIAQALADELDTDEYAAEFVKTFFYNGAAVDAVVAIKGATETQVKEFRASWSAKFQGSRNGHRTAFTSADVDVKQLGQSFKDMSIVELRKTLRDTCIQVFGVPPEVLGIVENSNRATIDGSQLVFALYVLVPRLDRLRAVIQQRVAPLFDDRAVVSYVSPVPEDRTHQLNVMRAAPQAFSFAEWRELAGKKARPGDEDLVIQPPAYPSFPANAEPAKLLPAPRRKAAEGDDDHEDVASAIDPAALVDEVEPIFQRRVEEWGQAELERLGLSLRFDLQNPEVIAHLEQLAGERIAGINDTTREAVRSTLAEGVAAGESIDDLAERVRDVFADAAGRRAETIARTEVLRSSNFGSWEAQVQSGVVKRRQWVATRDDRTREEHAALDGTVVELYEPFQIGSATAMHPGDFGVPELDIACRCTTIPLVDDEEPKDASALDVVWKKYDEALRPWETEARRALRRAFEKQRDAALAALRKRG